jgi:hypothetical protein
MAEVVTINEKEYIFDLNRENYRKYVLQDYEYATIQTKLASLTTAKTEEARDKGETIDEQTVGRNLAEVFLEEDVTLMQQIKMIEQEKVFYASLIKNYPEITIEESNNILDMAIEEFGNDQVSELCDDLKAKFAPKLKEDEPKKKMLRRKL